MEKVKYRFDEEKNIRLKKERGICFDDVIVAIAEGHLITILEHHNQDKYSHQDILVVEINGYAYMVPCIISGDEVVFLKTVYPSRKATEHFLDKLAWGGKNEKD